MNEKYTAIYEDTKHGLEILGYTDDLLRVDYKFTDILSPDLQVKEIPIATFSQYPPSYNNACFGVCIVNGKSDAQLISDFSSLGAPQIFEISSKGLSRWKIKSDGEPQYLDLIEPQQITDYFYSRRQEWSPNNISRVKTLRADIDNYQLDFADFGLLPLLDREVQSKFDRLLTRTIKQSIHNYPFIKDNLPELFRLIFRLIAGKILADREHGEQWLQTDVRAIISEVENFYFQHETPEPVLGNLNAQTDIWDDIRNSFHFQNLSVETLAYVYENTLMTPEIRKKTSTHGTPPPIAEYIVRHLPFEDLEDNERIVFEPFSGHAVFLVAALRRLRELLPPRTTSTERHEYFVNMLSGLEYEDFSREIARLSLILADYPNPNGWHLYSGDVFLSDKLAQEISKANIILCNPPFEDFTKDERDYYLERSSEHKPIELLNKVFNKPPKMLGFVLPRVFISGRGYRELRKALAETYSSIEVLVLPDNVFRYSGADTALLLAYGNYTGKINLSIGQVYKKDLNKFYSNYQPSYVDKIEIIADPKTFDDSIWLSELREIWDSLSGLDRLDKYITQIHRGIEYNVSLKQFKEEVVSEEERPYFVKGLRLVPESLEAFLVNNIKYLNIHPDNMRGNAYMLPWDKPKVIVNASRKTRGHWRIVAAEDNEGLYCTQYFEGIWLNAGVSSELISALLNSLIANAYISDYKLSARENSIDVIRQIPIPNFSEVQINRIVELVNQYKETREYLIKDGLNSHQLKNKCLKLLKLIDGEILQAYHLPFPLEKKLLDYFNGQKRPVPFEFSGYYSEKMINKTKQLQDRIKDVDLSVRGMPEEREKHKIELLEQFDNVRKRASTGRFKDEY